MSEVPLYSGRDVCSRAGGRGASRSSSQNLSSRANLSSSTTTVHPAQTCTNPLFELRWKLSPPPHLGGGGGASRRQRWRERGGGVIAVPQGSSMLAQMCTAPLFKNWVSSKLVAFCCQANMAYTYDSRGQILASAKGITAKGTCLSVSASVS